jgi:hypothetical protein
MSTIEPLPKRIVVDANAHACADERMGDDGSRPGSRERDCDHDHGGECGHDGGSPNIGHRIAGVTRDGKPFRPGDWAERLAGVITLFVKEKRPGSSVAATWLAVPFVKGGGVRCLSVSPRLAQVCPEAFDFVMRFARDNELMVEAVQASDADDADA